MFKFVSSLVLSTGLACAQLSLATSAPIGSEAASGLPYYGLCVEAALEFASGLANEDYREVSKEEFKATAEMILEEMSERYGTFEFSIEFEQTYRSEQYKISTWFDGEECVVDDGRSYVSY